MIYLNNAATTYPKPRSVQKAYCEEISSLPQTQFRSNNIENIDVFNECKKNLGKLLNIKNYKRIYFTSGATESLNTIIYGLKFSKKGFITTQTEHNSVLRPLFNLDESENNANINIIACDKSGYISPDNIKLAIKPQTKAIILNHCSNVTGAIQNIKEIGEIAKNNNLLFIVDASQSAGCIEIDVDKWNIDILIFTGHKGLFGAQGTGGFYLKEGINLKPLKYGGTGRDSKELYYSQSNYEYEVGTQNNHGIATLNAGILYVLKRGVNSIIKKENSLIDIARKKLSIMENVIVYGEPDINYGPVISFNINGLNSSDVAYILQDSYNIVTRAGLSCSPLIHKSLGTEKYGTVRISISDLTTKNDINHFLNAVYDIQFSVGVK